MQCWSADRVGLVEWWPPTRASVWYAGQQPKWLTRADQAVSVQVVPKHVHWVRNGRRCCASAHPALQVMESRAVLILDSLGGVRTCPLVLAVHLVRASQPVPTAQALWCAGTNTLHSSSPTAFVVQPTRARPACSVQPTPHAPFRAPPLAV